MRVLICDQETEMLETIARAFEVDVATSKVTCIDLMRANPFDVVVASERLSDGSGLELLSHIATRWPETLRVLVIEPPRLKLLRGKLGPFRLHATMKYPIDEEELETVMNRLYPLLEAGAEEQEEPEPEPPPPPPPPRVPRSAPVAPPRVAPPASAAAAARAAPAARPAPAAAAAPVANVQKPQVPQQPARGTSSSASGAKRTVPLGSPTGPAPVKRRLGNYTPLGSPEDGQMRIVEREFDHGAAPLASRAVRTREEAARPRTPSEKAKSLATHVGNTLRRLLKR